MLESLRQMVTGIGLVTTFTAERGPNVMAAEWTMLVAKNPPTIMVVINKRDATHEMILQSREFGVSVAAEGQADIVSLAGSFTGYETNKLSSDAIVTRPSTTIRAPMIEGAGVFAECKLKDAFDLGDYTAFTGEVLAASHDPTRMPLVYQGGRLATIAPIERPALLYVTGTYDPAKSSVRAEGRVRPVPSGGVNLVLRNSEAIDKAQAQPDQWGYYGHEWAVGPHRGEYTIEAESAGLKARAKLDLVGGA